MTYLRPEPRPAPPHRWPYLCCEVGGVEYWFRAPSITEATRLHQWLAALDVERAAAGRRAEAIRARLQEETVEGADAMLEEAQALAVSAVRLTVAPAGMLVLRCWADPARGLHARDDYDAERFARAAGDPRLAAGEAAWEELAAEWSDAEIMAVSGHLMTAISRAATSINWKEAGVTADFFDRPQV